MRGVRRMAVDSWRSSASNTPASHRRPTRMTMPAHDQDEPATRNLDAGWSSSLQPLFGASAEIPGVYLGGTLMNTCSASRPFLFSLLGSSQQSCCSNQMRFNSSLELQFLVSFPRPLWTLLPLASSCTAFDLCNSASLGA